MARAVVTGRYPERVSRRLVRALAVSAVAVPSMLLAHTLAVSAAPPPTAAALAALAMITVLAATPGLGAPEVSRGRVATATVAAQLLGQVVIGLNTGTRCLPMGPGAAAGLHLNLLRSDPGCPPGKLGLAPALTAILLALATALAAVLTTLLVLAVQTGVALAAAAGLDDAELRLARTLDAISWTPHRMPGWRVLHRLVALLAQALDPAPTQPWRHGALGAPRGLRTQWVTVPALRRGPPRPA